MTPSKKSLRRHSASRRLHSALPTFRRPLFEALENRSLLAVVSWWTADNTAVDSVSGNHGTLDNGVTYAAGHIGQAFSFDGVNDRVSIADSESLKLTRSMTLEAWIKVNAFPSGPPQDHGEILFRGDDRGGLDPYSLAVEPNGTLRFAITSATNMGASVQAPISLGQFIHVAATLDDATGAMKLYQNGALVSQATTTVRPFADLDPNFNPGVGIGNHGGHPNTPHNFPFNGLIDETKLYDHALSADEVLANFNATKGNLQTTISISSVTAPEGDKSGHFRSTFVNGTFNTLVFGPDNNLYAVGGGQGYDPWKIMRYDGTSGVLIDTFASGSTNNQFRDLIFHGDGYLYVASIGTDEVLRFDGATGQFVDVFVSAGSGGIDAPDGLAFGPDANGDGIAELYVTGWLSHNVVRYDGATGKPLGNYISSASGGLSHPFDVEFNGAYAYVTSAGTDQILKYSATTGSFIGIAASSGIDNPRDVAFGPDGLMYVSSADNDRILRFTANGQYVDDYVPAGAGGMNNPRAIAFGPDDNLYVAAPGADRHIYRFGTEQEVVFSITLSAPSAVPVSVDYSTTNGSALAGSDYGAASGTIHFSPGQTSHTILIPTVNDGAIELNETFSVNLSNPVGGVITRGTGIGTIIDDDTKFYVVNDGSSAATDKTFEYGGGSGPAGEHYGLDTGNTAPRGAASTAAGDKVWVVDANKKVFVYNTSGGLLGSWTAGSLSSRSNFQVQGIATNGTDIWIVENNTDTKKVDTIFRYAGAASRLSGSQSAAGSFNLNTANKNPTDIVTDGTYMWVVNDASTDRIFRYTLASPTVGVGSFTISTASPTGITLEPGNPSSPFWIVDNANDSVYQYARPANGSTTGTLSGSVLYVLAPGNTNPQGIADPPPPSSLLSTRLADLLASDALGQLSASSVNALAALLVATGGRTNQEQERIANSIFASRGKNDMLEQSMSSRTDGSVAIAAGNRQPFKLNTPAVRRSAEADSVFAEWDAELLPAEVLRPLSN